MDVIRTLYVDSSNATEHADKSFTLDVPGGLSVAEGARTYVDNVALTNVFSERVDDDSDEIYVKTVVNESLLNPADQTFNWSYTGTPFDRALAGTYLAEQRQWTFSPDAQRWVDPHNNSVIFTQRHALKYEWQLPSVIVGAADAWNINGSSVTFAPGANNRLYTFQQGGTQNVEFTLWDQQANTATLVQNGTLTATWNGSAFTATGVTITPPAGFSFQGVYPNAGPETLFVQDAQGAHSLGKSSFGSHSLNWTNTNQTMTLGPLVLTAASNPNMVTVAKRPVRNIAGLWTRSSDSATVTVLALSNRFHFSWAVGGESGVIVIANPQGGANKVNLILYNQTLDPDNPLSTGGALDFRPASSPS